VPGGISRSLEWSHLSAMLETEWDRETNPRRIGSRPCNPDPRAYQESASRMESCVHSSKIDPVILFPLQSCREHERFVPVRSWWWSECKNKLIT